VRVQFSGGRIEHADILVGGDGIRSSVRAQLTPEIRPIYAGYYIWRGAPNEADLTPETLRTIYPYFTFYLPKRQQVLGYPIAGFDDDLTPGKRRYNIIWYRVADAGELRDICIDENGLQHEYSVPPPLIRKDLIAQMHREARDSLPPALLDAVLKIKQPFIDLRELPVDRRARMGSPGISAAQPTVLMVVVPWRCAFRQHQRADRA
jgi:2-polyprenyl-6-methoxyphenol hydroxylase-like FAD-dependent oxidoreductase